jgi:hypothetical protein
MLLLYIIIWYRILEFIISNPENSFTQILKLILDINTCWDSTCYIIVRYLCFRIITNQFYITKDILKIFTLSNIE